MTIKLRGMGWNHERCMAPLFAASKTFASTRPDAEFHWDTRSLADFGDGHLEKLIDNYDLIVFDHPFVGQAEDEGLFLNLAEMLTPVEQSLFVEDSLGPCWQSYWTKTGLWAVPIDAAAQVATFLPEQLAQYRSSPPASIEDVFELAKDLSKDGLHVAQPCVAIDAICLFFTLTAALGDPVPRNPNDFPSYRTVSEALDVMTRLIDISHPNSLKWNPIQCFNYMAENDDVVYQPFAFGYSNYARLGYGRNILKFGNIPATGSRGCAGSILGGAGIGITRGCKDPDTALEFIRLVCSPEYQASEYVEVGGQPASRFAWQSPKVNNITGNFFADTFDTLEQSYLRPTFNGIIPWFRMAGELLVSYLEGEVSTKRCIQQLRDDFLLSRRRPLR